MSNQTPSDRSGSKTNPLSADAPISNLSQVNYIKVTANQHLQRLDNFLLARLKNVPKSHIYKLIRADEVRVNNKRVKPHNKLHQDDIVRLAPLSYSAQDDADVVVSDTLIAGLKSRIIYEDTGLIVLDKPTGIAVHGGSGVQIGVIEALRQGLDHHYLELVHRIDRDTSGLLMIAKKRSVLRQLQDALRQRHVKKDYLAAVLGHVSLDNQDINAPLLRYTLDNGERRVKVDQTGKSSLTHVQCLIRGQTTPETASRQSRQHNSHKPTPSNKSYPVSLVKASPTTGRTHQIRVHLAHLNHPIIADDKYAPDYSRALCHRLCLHAWRLSVEGYPPFQAPIPQAMRRLFDSQAHLLTAIEAATSADQHNKNNSL